MNGILKEKGETKWDIWLKSSQTDVKCQHVDVKIIAISKQD